MIVHCVIVFVAMFEVAAVAPGEDYQMTRWAMDPNQIQAWLQGPDHRWF